MKHPQLIVTKRDVLGKKIKQLRREGILPGNIYGKGLDSTAVQASLTDFQAIFREVGETGLVDLQLEGKTHPVLIKNLQMNHQDHILLHVDFFQVNLKEKVKTMVPLVIVGEPAAVTENVGLMLQSVSEVEVEALPENLPENIEVPVEHLAAIDDQVTVEDLKAPTGVEILSEPSQIIVKIAELVTKEAEEEAAAEEAAAEEASEAAEGETAEDETTGEDGAKDGESNHSDSEAKE